MATIERFVERATRLYEQDPKEPSGPSRLGMYVRRWVGWANDRRNSGRVLEERLYRRQSKVTGVVEWYEKTNPAHSNDARLVVAPSFVEVLRRPIESAQYASEPHRARLKAHGFVGSKSRRGNPYDNAKSLPRRKRGPKAS